MKLPIRSLLLTGAIALALPVAVHATTINFDFSKLPTGDVHPGNATVSGITATGYDYNTNTSSYDPADLWVRDSSSDHGLGICNATERATSCASTGNVNEISNQLYKSNGMYDVLALNNTNGGDWTSLWVSSLDSGGTNNSEHGVVYWSSSPVFTPANSFHFKYSDFGANAVQADLFSLPAFTSVFNASDTYLAFTPDNTNCKGNTCNNDYLVWKGSVSVPEPSTLALLGLSLVGLGFAMRRHRAS